MLPEQNSQVSSLKGNSVLVSLFSYPCKLILLIWAGDLDHYSCCGCQTQGIAVYEEWIAVIQGKRMKRRIVWDHLKALKQVIYLVNLMNCLVLLHSGWLLIKILSISLLTTSSSLEPLPSPFKAISFFCFSNSLSLTLSATCKTGLIYWISTYFYASGYSHLET